MPYETLSLDVAIDAAEIPSPPEIMSLRGTDLHSAANRTVSTLAHLTGRPEPDVWARLLKAINIKHPKLADDHDCREALRIARCWSEDPAACTATPRRPKIERPDGTGQLPVPRIVKPAHLPLDCHLCGDPVKPGDLTGRFRAHREAFPYENLGWLCQHCLVERRHTPRRRDILIRLWHQLLAGCGTDLNSHECHVLLNWLTPSHLAATDEWKADPLDATLVRLTTSVHEDKRTTALATTTVHTILAVLSTTDLSCSEETLLRAMIQHLHAWAVSPTPAQRRRYGTGAAYRAHVLSAAPEPTVLSRGGGPFYLHTAPRPKTESVGETTAD
ncbi:hypothetical protein [Streptomyces sp. BH055]|uniref:hypothetical protein n=1 Tax=Streptomyces sp. BH055 TaxID=3401173 RepID=UPI003BB488E1